MLQRSSSASAALRSRRARARRRAGRCCYTITISGEVLSALVRWNWISEHEVTDKIKVAQAIARGLEEAAAARR
jgi:hypothetical protein